jgi:hypothetical protein
MLLLTASLAGPAPPETEKIALASAHRPGLTHGCARVSTARDDSIRISAQGREWAATPRSSPGGSGDLAMVARCSAAAPAGRRATPRASAAPPRPPRRPADVAWDPAQYLKFADHRLRPAIAT